jgi:hypothetical protein
MAGPQQKRLYQSDISAKCHRVSVFVVVPTYEQVHLI